MYTYYDKATRIWPYYNTYYIKAAERPEPRKKSSQNEVQYKIIISIVSELRVYTNR